MRTNYADKRPKSSSYEDIYPLAYADESPQKERMKPKTVNPIVARIDQEIARQKTTRSAVCLKAGLSRDFLRKMADRGVRASARNESLQKICAVLGLDLSGLAADVATEPPADAKNISGEIRLARVKGLTSRAAPRDLPVRGTAAGALATNGFRLSDEIIDFVNRPPALAGIDEAYGIYVVGNSMEPLHKPGDLCCVHPGRPCLPGDSVIIQVKLTENGPIEGYIKTLVEITKDWVVTRQYNPIGEVKYKTSTVFKMHHVMTMRELFGV